MSDDLNWAQHARVTMVGDDERLVLLPLAILTEEMLISLTAASLAAQR